MYVEGIFMDLDRYLNKSFIDALEIMSVLSFSQSPLMIFFILL